MPIISIIIVVVDSSAFKISKQRWQTKKFKQDKQPFRSASMMSETEQQTHCQLRNEIEIQSKNGRRAPHNQKIEPTFQKNHQWNNRCCQKATKVSICKNDKSYLELNVATRLVVKRGQRFRHSLVVIVVLSSISLYLQLWIVFSIRFSIFLKLDRSIDSGALKVWQKRYFVLDDRNKRPFLSWFVNIKVTIALLLSIWSALFFFSWVIDWLCCLLLCFWVGR